MTASRRGGDFFGNVIESHCDSSSLLDQGSLFSLVSTSRGATHLQKTKPCALSKTKTVDQSCYFILAVTTIRPPYLKDKLMRLILLAVVATLAFPISALAQSANPFANVLNSPAVLKVAENDDQQTGLLKQCFNAAHNEMRIRYNYWLQGISEIDGLLASIDRLHKLRVEIVSTASELEFVEQKLAFVKEIESQCAKANSKAKFEALREINEASASAFRMRVELELAKLKIGVGAEAQLPRETSVAPSAVKSSTRWEYKLCDGNGTGSTAPLNLNELGQEGWELVSTICDNSAGGNGIVRHYLKRKLSKPNP